MPYFNLVVHPTDFAQTVENIFYTSFLVKEGFAAMKIINDIPHIGTIRSFCIKLSFLPFSSNLRFRLNCRCCRLSDIAALVDNPELLADSTPANKGARKQYIMEITYGQWQDIIKVSDPSGKN